MPVQSLPLSLQTKFILFYPMIKHPRVLYYSGFSRETVPTDIKRNLLWVFGSHDYGGWETLWSVVYKLETEENQGCKSQSKENQCPTQEDKQVGHEYPRALLFVLLRPSMDWVMLTDTGKGRPLYHAHQQMLVSSGNTLTDMPEITFHLGTPWCSQIDA